MAASAAVSVAAFSVVLAETFAAVGLSSLVPQGFITLARAAKQAAGADADLTAGDLEEMGSALSAISKSEEPGKSVSPGKAASRVLTTLAKGVDDLDVLLPKNAKIHAEFEFHGSEAFAGEAGVGCAVEVVTVKAGYSGMYAVSSSNKVTLDIEFQSVQVKL